MSELSQLPEYVHKSELDAAQKRIVELKRQHEENLDLILRLAAAMRESDAARDSAKLEVEKLKKILSGWQDRYTNLRRELDIEQPTQPDSPERKGAGFF